MDNMTAFKTLVELRAWLSDNCYMQAEPATVSYTEDGKEITQVDCIEAIDVILKQLETKGV